MRLLPLPNSEEKEGRTADEKKGEREREKQACKSSPFPWEVRKRRCQSGANGDSPGQSPTPNRGWRISIAKPLPTNPRSRGPGADAQSEGSAFSAQSTGSLPVQPSRGTLWKCRAERERSASPPSLYAPHRRREATVASEPTLGRRPLRFSNAAALE